MNCRSYTIIAVLFCCVQSIFARPFPERVLEVSYGSSAGFGQEYFPENVLGAPDSSAAPQFPSANPEEILTLGTDGWIILSFEDDPIIDGDGFDFTVFENAFYFGEPPRVYTEAGIVSVSEDGNQWVEFPYNPDTLAGLAGITPVDGAADPLNPDESGGDSFDLSEIGVELVRYIRITDAGDLVTDLGPSFDLDAVAGLHFQVSDVPSTTPIASDFNLEVYPNPFNSTLHVSFENELSRQFRLRILNMMGQEIILSDRLAHSWEWQSGNTAAGIYLIQLLANNKVLSSRQVVLLR
ncbi:T9SS type A sorting domain-containing protein [bacterium]|nr:T9SS type A sorting domain-containing protein [bacterium]